MAADQSRHCLLLPPMEAEDWANYSDGSETCGRDINEEEFYYVVNDVSKLQVRKEISKACWNVELGMAEVIEMKGQMWKTTGIVHRGKIYCLIEEALYLAEIGALHLLNNENTLLSLNDMYKKVAERRSGCCWEAFVVYRHLKSLGYIVIRHDVPWSMKNVRGYSASIEDFPRRKEIVDEPSEDTNLNTELFQNLHVSEVKPIFDVYYPNGNFRKSSPGDPSFLLCLASEHPPSRQEVDYLERCYKGCHLKFCHVDHGRVSFFSLDKVELPLLP